MKELEPIPTLLDYQPHPSRVPDRTRRFVVWVLVVAALFCGTLACFTVLFPPFYSTLGANLFTGWLGLGAAVLVMGYLLATTPPDAIRLHRWMSWAAILGGSAVLNVAGLGVTAELSDDVLRYRLDARLAAAGKSVYQKHDFGMAVASPAYNESYLDAQTPHQYLATIYPPIAQGVFRLAHTIGPGIRPGGDKVRVFDLVAVSEPWWKRQFHRSSFAPAMRLLAAVASLATTAILLSALATLGRSPWYAALFAWNPLTLMETSVQSHVDIFGVMFMVLAIWLALRQRFLIAMIALALAAGVKPHVVVLAPVFLLSAALQRKGVAQPERQDFKSALSGAVVPGLVFVFALLAVYAPILSSRANLEGWAQTAQVYSAAWEANGSVYEVITAPFRTGDGRSLETAKLIARLLGGLGLAGTLYLVIRMKLQIADGAYWVTLIPLLLAPVVYPWYLLWGLAVVPLLLRTGGWTLLVWSATSVLSYQLLREPAWRLPYPWLAAEYLPVFTALAIELWRMLRTSPTAPASSGC